MDIVSYKMHCAKVNHQKFIFCNYLVILSIAKDLIAGKFQICCGKRFFAEFTLSEANVLRMTGL